MNYGLRTNKGSALLLAVVLTSLLAIVGVMFIMFARVEKMSTSAVTTNKELNFAVDSVIAKISQQLALDVPRADANGQPIEESYDYPDAANPWLASIEPYVVRHPTDPNFDEYYWRQITDVTGYLLNRGFIVQGVNVKPFNLSTTEVVREYSEITLDNSGRLIEQSADADGDGIADSKWIQLYDVTTGKGKPIYAAIRIIDNGGVINANTAYRFNPNDPNAPDIDGSSQTQINLAALARGADTIEKINIGDVNIPGRNPANKPIPDYQNNVVWNLEEPNKIYLPFDISDELDLRYRYCIDSGRNHSRLETLWSQTLPSDQNEPYAGGVFGTLHQWCRRVTEDPTEIKPDRRHLLTKYNIDRIIIPDGGKMFNINNATAANKNNVFGWMKVALRDSNLPAADVNAMAAQIAVNLIDFRDNDERVTTIDINDLNIYYGFERPCIYISELAQSFYDPCDAFSPIHPPDPNSTDPNIRRSYAIELHKPYIEDNDPCGWQVSVYDATGLLQMVVSINWAGTGRFHVLLHEDVNAPLRNAINPPDGATGVGPDIVLKWPKVKDAVSYDVYFGANFNSVRDANNTPGLWPEFKGNQTVRFYDPPGVLDMNTTYYWRIDDINSFSIINKGDVWSFTTGAPNSQIAIADINFVSNYLIVLQREVNSVPIVVDSVVVPLADLSDPNRWWIDDVNTHIAGYSFQRDIHPHKSIRRLWDRPLSRGGFPTIGGFNFFVGPVLPSPFIQAHPENKPFTNIGEMGMLFRKRAYYNIGENPSIPGSGVIGFDPYSGDEPNVRVDLADPNFQQMFKYLTVFDPNKFSNETRIKGRVNINTAPWYVIAQLPWVSQRKGGYNNDANLAHAIVAYRDKTATVNPNGPDYSARRGEPGFRNIGELVNVLAANRDYSMDYYARDGNDLAGFPDLTPGGILGDGAPDDFEERDVIFSRISNLVTVRSDVFTAYILIRIGVDGPQKRVIAILDRSLTTSPADKVRVIAIQQTPEPR